MKEILFALMLTHYAPSGWEYPWFCCSGHDCHVIDCNKLTPTEDGWKYPDPLGFLTFNKEVRSSPDGECHGCWVFDKDSVHAPVGRCLFMPKGTV